MLRRSILVALAGTLVAGCALESEVEPPADATARMAELVTDEAGLEVVVVDDETPFSESGQPYVRALDDAGLFDAEPDIEVTELPPYGRVGGAQVEHSLAPMSAQRATLEQFFSGLPERWRLPPTHAIRYGLVGSSTEAKWRAYIVHSDGALTLGDVAEVETTGLWDELMHDRVDVLVRLTPDGARRFAQLSGDNVGRKIAIVVDDMVLSDPIVNERIAGGEVRISFGEDAPEHSAAIADALARTLAR